MKKLISTLLVLAIMLCSLAMAEAKTVKPMVPEIDLAAPADGIYGVVFEPSDLADGTLKCTVYTEDCYDIVDISTLAEGDTIYLGGIDFQIESLERADDLIVNGGWDNGGFNLRPFDEDNCWKAVMDDDYTTWTAYGETTLPLDDAVSFTDGWDIEKEPVTVSGAEAVEAAIHGTDMEYFAYLNTTVRVENGRIVEINRSYMP